MTALPLTDLLTAIVQGDYDGDEQAIYDAFKTRRSIRSQIAGASFKPGDKVRIAGDIRPKYLIGLEGTIDHKRGKGFVLEGLGPVAQQYQRAAFPADCLEAI